MSKPRKCEKCEKTHVFKAYRIICDPCAFKDKKTGVLYCTKCTLNVKLLTNAVGSHHYAVPHKRSKKEDEKYE